MTVFEDEGEFLLTRLEHIFYQREKRDGTHKRDTKTTIMYLKRSEHASTEKTEGQKTDSSHYRRNKETFQMLHVHEIFRLVTNRLTLTYHEAIYFRRTPHFR